MPGDPEDRRQRLLAAVDAQAGEAIALSDWMAGHPELSLEERETSARYRRHLAARDFALAERTAGMETAFVATRGAPDAPLRVALLAATALAEVLAPEAARIAVIGCPAEETGVGKRRLVEAGVFGDFDVAMMAHASDMRRAHRLFLGNHKFELVFHGRASHAAAYPERGVNALDGVIAFFVGVGLLRQQLPREARVHAIVSDGGQAPNVIPERAAARVWVRALDDAVLADTERRVLACARGAAESTGTRLELRDESGASPPMKPNLPLADSYRRQLDFLGLDETSHAPTDAIGSSDITHVSRVLPTIHPNFPIHPGRNQGRHAGRGENGEGAEAGLQLHTRAFAEATVSPEGREGLLEAARALALTVLELVEQPDRRDAIRAAFEA